MCDPRDSNMGGRCDDNAATTETKAGTRVNTLEDRGQGDNVDLRHRSS